MGLTKKKKLSKKPVLEDRQEAGVHKRQQNSVDRKSWQLDETGTK